MSQLLNKHNNEKNGNANNNRNNEDVNNVNIQNKARPNIQPPSIVIYGTIEKFDINLLDTGKLYFKEN